jgi:hypothetical protein
MSIAKGTFSLICSNCGQQHDFTADDADFELRHGSERQMGPENGYVWEHAFECDGKNCSNEIEIEYEVYEYPVGAFNMDEVKISGGQEKHRFEYDFHGEPETDDFE